MKSFFSILTTAALTATFATAPSSALSSGGDQRVNTTFASTQERPAIAVHDSGWAATWQSREGTADLEIKARVADSSGLSSELLVSSTSIGTQQRPDIAADADGNFAVVWYSNEPAEAGGDDSGYGIAARLFFADGTPVGPAFQVNDLTSGHQLDPSISMADDGRFAVAWRSSTSAGTDDSGASVQARLFFADGTPMGPGFQVNQHTSLDQQYPDVAMRSDGRFVVAWQSLLQDGSVDGIYARRFSATGTPLAGETRINIATAGSQDQPAVAVADDGRYMIVWQTDTGESYTGIRGRIFTWTGSSLTNELVINTLTDGVQSLPDVAAMHNGFAIVWQSSTSSGDDDDGYSIQARILSLGGKPTGNELQINTEIDGNQQNAAVGADGPALAILWDGDQDLQNEEDIYLFEPAKNRSR